MTKHLIEFNLKHLRIQLVSPGLVSNSGIVAIEVEILTIFYFCERCELQMNKINRI